MTKYYVNEFGMGLQTAALLAACFSLPGGVLRAVGGWLSDRYGAYKVTWWVMWVSWVCLFLLSYPHTEFTVRTVDGPRTFSIHLNVWTFTTLMFIVGVAWAFGEPASLAVFLGSAAFLGGHGTTAAWAGQPLAASAKNAFDVGIAFAFGKASVFKYISNEFPGEIGAVSGIVGLVGGMGGFLLPIMFGALLDLTGVRSSAFMLLYGVTWVSLIWMYLTEVRRTDLLDGHEVGARTDAGSAKA